MGFLGVYKAIYDYAPQSEGELQLAEGDVLYVLEKSTEDDWWKCKKKATSDDDDEPEGLVPNNYIEEVKPLYHAKALYDYTKQTDEELSFKEKLEGKKSKASGRLPLAAQADFAYLYKLATGVIQMPEDKVRRREILQVLKGAVRGSLQECAAAA